MYLIESLRSILQYCSLLSPCSGFYKMPFNDPKNLIFSVMRPKLADRLPSYYLSVLILWIVYYYAFLFVGLKSLWVHGRKEKLTSRQKYVLSSLSLSFVCMPKSLFTIIAYNTRSILKVFLYSVYVRNFLRMTCKLCVWKVLYCFDLAPIPNKSPYSNNRLVCRVYHGYKRPGTWLVMNKHHFPRYFD